MSQFADFLYITTGPPFCGRKCITAYYNKVIFASESYKNCCKGKNTIVYFGFESYLPTRGWSNPGMAALFDLTIPASQRERVLCSRHLGSLPVVMSIIVIRGKPSSASFGPFFFLKPLLHLCLTHWDKCSRDLPLSLFSHKLGL